MEQLRHLWLGRPQIINNPIIRRELLVRLRRFGAFFQLGVFLLSALTVILLFWSNFSSDSYSYRNADLGRQCFLAITFVQGIIAVLIVPMLSAASINIEYERETWDLVVTTPISIASLFVGKFISSILFVVILMFSLIPIYGISFTMGGVSPQEVAFVMLIILEVVVITSLFGMLASIYCRTTIRSISVAYLLTFGYYIGFKFFGFIIMEALRYRDLARTLWWCTPVGIGSHFIYGSPQLTGAVWLSANPYVLHGVFASSVIFILLWLCFRRLKVTDHSTQPESIVTRGYRNIFKLTEVPQPIDSIRDILPEQKMMPDGINPIKWKEMKFYYGMSMTRFVRGIVILFLIGLVINTIRLHAGSIEFENSWQPPLAYPLLFIVPFFICAMGANTFQSEYNRDTWDLLRSTTLTPWSILRGKFNACMTVFSWRFLALGGVGLLLMLFFPWEGRELINRTRAQYTVVLLLMIGVSSIFYLSMAMTFSAWFKRTIHAYFASLVTAYGVMVGLPIILAIIESAFSSSQAEFLSGVISPLTLFAHFSSKWGPFVGSTWWMAFGIQMGWMLFISGVLCWITAEHLAERK